MVGQGSMDVSQSRDIMFLSSSDEEVATSLKAVTTAELGAVFLMLTDDSDGQVDSFYNVGMNTGECNDASTMLSNTTSLAGPNPQKMGLVNCVQKVFG